MCSPSTSLRARRRPGGAAAPARILTSAPRGRRWDSGDNAIGRWTPCSRWEGIPLTNITAAGFLRWCPPDLRSQDLVVCKSACFSLRALDAGQDLVGVLGPGERAGVVVPAVDEGADGVGELADRGERA